MSVLVFAEAREGKFPKGALEAASYGKRIADALGTDCHAITLGAISDDAAASLGQYGVKQVHRSSLEDAVDNGLVASLVDSAAQAAGADVVVFSHDLTGKAVAPRVAIRMKAGLVAGANGLPSMDGGFKVKKNVFSGKAFAHEAIQTEKKVISLIPNSVAPEETGGSAEVQDFSFEGTARVTTKETKKRTGTVSLPDAEIVVSAGRGLKGPENWGMVEELADTLGAATACSRPVADIGWRPHHEHVGQTGVAIRPNLYFAIGISGAIQHLAGVNGSKTIVVINTDDEAPFFKAADYGIVGDAFEVVPKLKEAISRFKTA